MNTLAEALDSVVLEVERDPQSPRLSETVAAMIQQLDQFLAAPELDHIDRLGPQERAAIAGKVEKAAGTLRDMLSVAEQIEEMGGHAPWRPALADGVERFKRAFKQLGPAADPSRRPPPIVIRVPATAGGAPSFRIANETRRPELEPYIAVALRSARTRELEPGHWYADLDAFPGVWADGASPEECLAILADVLHEWLVIKLAHGDRDIPVLGGIDPTKLVHG
jgi:predicted RNase H-like HicB family nuclease